MRSALRVKQAPRAQKNTVISYPPPVGGWNARDALSDMDRRDAVALDNWFPNTSYVEMRGGNAEHATGMTNNGKTLAVYNALDGTSKMFCTTSSGTYDVSSAGAVGASAAARTNGKHQWVNFGDGTNNYLIMVNGVDKPLYYNGSTWTAVDGVSSPALTGLTTTEIVNVFVGKGRLFFMENDSLSFWYLAAGAAGGALTEFDLSSVAARGGYLMAGGMWTVDAGNGPDDRFVFITSKGEIIVYAGTDPSSATTWTLVGVYTLAEPLGRRCAIKYGADLVILTENGAFPMIAAIQKPEEQGKLALSFKIENAFNTASRSYGNNFGWTAVVYPDRSALIINIPIAEDGVHYQYVMNTITTSWCRFLEWDAEDFAIFNRELYFCDGTNVYKAWTGNIDDTDNIEAYGKTAFSYFKSPGEMKHFQLFRPVLSVNGPLSFLVDIDVDFADGEIVGEATYSVDAVALWDTAKWDEDVWAYDLEVVKEWTTPAEYPGYAAAGKIKVATNSLDIQWISCDYVYTKGGPL